MQEQEKTIGIAVEFSLPTDTERTIGARIEEAKLDARWNLRRSQSTSAAKSFFGDQAARFGNAVEKTEAIYERLSKSRKIIVELVNNPEEAPYYQIWRDLPEDDQSIAFVEVLDEIEFDILTQILLPTHENDSIRNAQNQLMIDSINIFLGQQNRINITLPSSPLNLEPGIALAPIKPQDNN